LVTGTREADAVFDDFGAIYTAHAVLALIGGLLFAASVLRARVFPRWTAYTLAAGLLLTAVFVLLGFSEEVQTLGTAVRSVAFAAMGIVCLRTQEPGWRSTRRDMETSVEHERRLDRRR